MLSSRKNAYINHLFLLTYKASTQPKTKDEMVSAKRKFNLNSKEQNQSEQKS